MGSRPWPFEFSPFTIQRFCITPMLTFMSRGVGSVSIKHLNIKGWSSNSRTYFLLLISLGFPWGCPRGRGRQPSTASRTHQFEFAPLPDVSMKTAITNEGPRPLVLGFRVESFTGHVKDWSSSFPTGHSSQGQPEHMESYMLLPVHFRTLKKLRQLFG